MEIAGLKVVDATKPLLLHITLGDVKHGDNKNPSACAAAQCIMRQEHVDAVRVHIGRTYLRMKGDKKWTRYKTGDALRTEIVSFDRGGKFAPGEYYITPLPPSQREKALAGKRQGGRDAPGRKRKPKVARVHLHQVTGIRARGATR